MPRKLRVGVIFGGRSGEHEVSLVSASSIIEALDKTKYEIIPIGITKEGRWVTSKDSLKLLKTDLAHRLSRVLFPADPEYKRLIRVSKQKKDLAKLKEEKKLDVIFPVLHGPYGEDGTIQGLLELAGIPYIGAGVLASAIGMDKVVQKNLYKKARLKIVKYIWFTQKEFKKNSKFIIRNSEFKLGYPCFVKPANLGSSVGVTKARSRKELKEGIEEALKYDRKIIIEEGIEKAREIEVSVLGNDEPKASIPGEIIPTREFYDYDAKYLDGGSKIIIPAKLPSAVTRKIQDTALKAYKAIDCQGMGRVDFLVQKDEIYLSEINTIPGFTSQSMYPKLWEASGLSYPKLLDQLIELALERYQEKSKLLTSYKPRKKWYR